MVLDTPTNDGLKHLIEHIQDAVVAFELIESDPIVRGVNGAFVEQFGYSKEEIVGGKLNAWIVPPWLQESAADLDRRTESGEINYQQVQRQTTTGLREFLYRGIPYGDSDGPIDGYAVYTDLTETTRRERQLKVLNRLLRHNLRNKALIIEGNLDILLHRLLPTDSDEEKAARAASAAAEELRKLAEEATQINRVLNSCIVGTGTVDVVPIVRDVAEDFDRQNPSATIETDLPESLPVVGTTEFRAAIEGLVENAIEHNSNSSPLVVICMLPGPENGWIDLAVEDDGPGIPTAERDVIAGEAEITQTRHGRGLGLWLVKWTVERSGGQLLFDGSEIGGNRVRLRLRRSA